MRLVVVGVGTAFLHVSVCQTVAMQFFCLDLACPALPRQGNTTTWNYCCLGRDWHLRYGLAGMLCCTCWASASERCAPISSRSTSVPSFFASTSFILSFKSSRKVCGHTRFRGFMVAG